MLSDTVWKRRTILLVSAVALFFLYLFGLTRTGLIGPDEPRYAAIGQAMAQSGDWITPKLWGNSWFEKPPLLYWMTAVGFQAGLGEDLAPRLPVALISVGFLIYFFLVLRREFDERVGILLDYDSCDVRRMVSIQPRRGNRSSDVSGARRGNVGSDKNCTDSLTVAVR